MKTNSSDEIYAQGDVRIRLIVVIGVFVVATVLGVGGIWFAIAQPDKARDFWIIIGPVITAAISGSLGFLAGRRHAAR
jgi:ABC-type proline/glycine betaine transport system permease subunit